jgi:hypothetical protein
MVRRATRIGIALIATVAIAAAGVTMSPSAAQPRASPRVPCSDVISQQASGTADGNRVVLGLVSVPPARIEHGVTSGIAAWKYFSKWGMAIRSHTAVTVSVPRGWRSRVAVTWGASTAIAASIHFAPCRSTATRSRPWNSYPGGFFMDTPTTCVPLRITVGHHSRTLRFGIGRNC